MATESFKTDLQLAEKLLYSKCGFQLQNLVWNSESANYAACSFELNIYKIQFRVANITPTKIGQFVAIWKRNKEGITAPFDVGDSLDFMIIYNRKIQMHNFINSNAQFFKKTQFLNGF